MGKFKGDSEFEAVDIEGANGNMFTIDLETSVRCDLKNTACWRDLEAVVAKRGHGMSHTAVINNFSLQHIIVQPLDTIKEKLKIWASEFQKGISAHAVDGSKPPKLFLLNGSYLHGFREAATTNARMARLNGLFEKVLGPMGFQTVDGFAMEAARVYASSDGMHFNDYINYVMVQSFLHQLQTDNG